MSTQHGAIYAAITALLLSAPAVATPMGVVARRASRPQLMLRLSEALQSFDRGSALLKSEPHEAQAAFQKAHDVFHAVIDAGIENGRLYYNLGNTHLRMGRLGEALADYRRAERLIPNDERLKANLRFARSLTRDRIEASGKRELVHTLFFWHYSSPLRTRRTVAMIGYGLFWLFLAVRALSPQRRLGYPALACLLLWMTLGASVAVDLPSQRGPTEGVLVADHIVVRTGNGEGYDPRFEQPLYEGVEFKIIEQRGSWIHIELADGNQGWVHDREVELF